MNHPAPPRRLPDAGEREVLRHPLAHHRSWVDRAVVLLHRGVTVGTENGAEEVPDTSHDGTSRGLAFRSILRQQVKVESRGHI
jgi:hypothetical protein